MTEAEIQPKIVSPDAWTHARLELLAKEKEVTDALDELSRLRRALPWKQVEKNYIFHGPNGEQSLSDLFGGRSQLIVYHFMFGPDWEEGCPSCSFLADHIDGTLVHLAHRDVSLVVISRAPWDQIARFQQRMGWKFQWVSSHDNDFNFDYHVSFTPEEMKSGAVYYNFAMGHFPSTEAPGTSVFRKDESGTVFHTYSAYARGVESLLGTYNFLDLTSKGRDEDALAFTMSWVRHHDRYDDGEPLDPNRGYVHPKVAGSCCYAQGQGR